MGEVYINYFAIGLFLVWLFALILYNVKKNDETLIFLVLVTMVTSLYSFFNNPLGVGI